VTVPPAMSLITFSKIDLKASKNIKGTEGVILSDYTLLTGYAERDLLHFWKEIIPMEIKLMQRGKRFFTEATGSFFYHSLRKTR
jgi:hypothetical protein